MREQQSKYLLIFFLAFSSIYCNQYLPGFDFQLFDNAPVSELSKAVEDQNTLRIEEILKDTAVKIDYKEKRFGNTLLMLAVANNKKESVKSLLYFGADPNLKSDYDSETAVMVACNNYHAMGCDTEILKELIKYNGDINAIQNYIEDDGPDFQRRIQITPLMRAIATGKCLAFIKYMVNSGADINKYTDEETDGPIPFALLFGHYEIAKYLIIEKKANIPQYCLIRNQDGKVTKLTATDLLKEHYSFDNPKDSSIKNEIKEFIDKK